jgi:hypothetical protein
LGVVENLASLYVRDQKIVIARHSIGRCLNRATTLMIMASIVFKEI